MSATSAAAPTLYRATVLDTPGSQDGQSPVGQTRLRADADAGLLVQDGAILRRGPWREVVELPEAGGADVVDLRDGVLLPGFVDTHVHFPQVRVIGGLGLPLLEWLELLALPEEARMADVGLAAAVAGELVSGLASCGTTSALVFGAHFPAAVDALFATAAGSGLRITSGLVVADRRLRDDLHTDPVTAHREGLELARRWHGQGRLRYAVTPRFSLAASDELLDSCRTLLDEVEGAWFTSHLNESVHEVAEVARLFPDAVDYLDSYDRHGLVTPRSVLAHDVHPTDRELARIAEAGAAVAHCPTSNASLGSGLFPLRRHVGAGVRVALGSDVGGGTGFCMLKEALQAFFTQQQLGEQGLRLHAPDLLRLATRAGAEALGLVDVGHLGEGMQLDAVLIRPPSGSPLEVTLRHARDAEDALAKIFALGTPADIASVWVAGREPNVTSPIPTAPRVSVTAKA